MEENEKPVHDLNFVGGQMYALHVMIGSLASLVGADQFRQSAAPRLLKERERYLAMDVPEQFLRGLETSLSWLESTMGSR